MRPAVPAVAAAARLAAWTLVGSAGLACAAVPSDADSYRELAEGRRAGFRAAVHGQVQAVLREWADAVARDDIDRVLDLYAPDAWTLLDHPAQGPDLEPALTRWVRGTRGVLTGPADFDFSGDLAFADVRLLLTTAEGRRRTGSMLVVLRRAGGGWRIRSQLINLAAR